MKLHRLLLLGMLPLLVGAQSPPAPKAPAPPVAIEAGKWPQEPRWSGPGPMPRHHMVLTWGVPEPYAAMSNPLPHRRETLERGRSIYRQYCAVCHGDNGAGNGPAASGLKPPPGNLVWLSDVPEKQWDAFMYWSIAEGGTALGTSMPPYRQLLTPEEIWAVIAYVEENIPFVSRLR